jgi:hypothetical protein
MNHLQHLDRPAAVAVAGDPCRMLIPEGRDVLRRWQRLGFERTAVGMAGSADELPEDQGEPGERPGDWWKGSDTPRGG